jgi:2-oxo-4-hydroxy-4-carboxy-5-ureidoimidazoline decarboxylase
MSIHTGLPITIAQLNLLDRESFTALLGHLFEATPSIAETTWDARPFASRDALHMALVATMWSLAPEQQRALIEAHPDLAGRAAIAGDLTPESAREQASARLDQLTPDEYARFHSLNSAYRERFGFPFIICVREHTRASILENFERRISHERADEIATALTEIGKIAGLRLRDAVVE